MGFFDQVLKIGGTVVGAVTGGPAGAAAGYQVGSSLGGGSASGGGCSNQTPTDVASLVISKLSATERSQVAAWLSKWGYGQYSSLTNPERVAWAFAGGSDCKTTTIAAQDGPAMWDGLVSKYGSSSFYEAPLPPPDPRTTAGGGSIFGGQPIGSTGANLPANPSSGGAESDFWSRLGRDLFGGGGGGTGATPGPATAGSVFWNQPTQQAPVGTATLAGAGLDSSKLLLWGGVGLLVVVLLVVLMGNRK